MAILLWYRNDLRMQDHEALHRAIATTPDTILPLYCFDPRQWGETSFGFVKTGAFRSQFLLESIADLRASWRSQQRDLILRRGKPEDIIPALVQQHGITAVYYHSETTSEEQFVERAIALALKPLKVQIKTFWGQTLYHPDDLPFDLSQLPDLFTNFRKQVEKQSTVNQTFPVPNQLPPLPNIAAGDLPSLADWNLESAPVDPRSVLQFQGGETAGLARLQDYIWQQDCLRSYKETRNGMKGANYSSKFSPWLALGCLSPRTIYESIQAYETQRIRNDSTYWLVFELLWRDYFRFVAAKQGDRLFHRAGLQRTELPWQQDWQRFEAWRTGKTGYPLVDANMRELAASGFMSNRGRQNVVSFLTKNLAVDWRMGAEWFESLLIDYDVCSNWGNWLYGAGVGNDARGFRFFNITKQSKDYDRQGEYIKHWLPELSLVPRELIHEPWKLSTSAQEQAGITLGVDYPMPMVDLFQSAEVNEQIYNRAFKLKARSRS